MKNKKTSHGNKDLQKLEKDKITKSGHFSSMRRIIFACMILVPLIPFILALGTGYYYFMTSLENSSIASMKRIVEDHRYMIESFLNERKNDLDFIIYVLVFWLKLAYTS